MKNKGFTLIELLAIIVILAVIMVIAVPKILGIVNGSKNSAWKSNVSMIEKAITKNSKVLDVETGTYKYSINNLCVNTDKLKNIVKLNDTIVTCDNNVFSLTGKGQFKGKRAEIICINNKCTTEIINTIPDSELAAGLYDSKNNMIISYDEFVAETGFDVEHDDAGSGYFTFTDGKWYSKSYYNGGYNEVGYNTVPDSVLSKALQFDSFKDTTKIILPYGITKIARCKFRDTTSLTSIYIPESVVEIQVGAFENSGISFISIPESVTTIGSGVGKLGVFSTCLNLKEVILPDNVINFNSAHMFQNCFNLTYVKLPDNITQIDEYCFYGCRLLEVIDLPGSITSIGMMAFYECAGLKSIAIPNSVTSFGVDAFGKCKELVSVNIPDGVTVLPAGLFKDCSKLENVSIPDSVIEIGNSAFSYCENLKGVVLPNNLVKIGLKAFEECQSLTEITIPSSVQVIMNYPFRRCLKLKKIIVEDPNNWLYLQRQTYTRDCDGEFIAVPADAFDTVEKRTSLLKNTYCWQKAQ